MTEEKRSRAIGGAQVLLGAFGTLAAAESNSYLPGSGTPTTVRNFAIVGVVLAGLGLYSLILGKNLPRALRVLTTALTALIMLPLIGVLFFIVGMFVALISGEAL